MHIILSEIDKQEREIPKDLPHMNETIGSPLEDAAGESSSMTPEPVRLLALRRQVPVAVSVDPESGNQTGKGEGKDPLVRFGPNTDLPVGPKPTVRWEVAPDTPGTTSTIRITQPAKSNPADASVPVAKTPPSAPNRRQSDLSGDPGLTNSATSATASSSGRLDHSTQYHKASLASSWATYGEAQEDPSLLMDPLPTFHFNTNANNHQKQQDEAIKRLQFQNLLLHCSAFLGLLAVVAIALGVLFGMAKS